MMKKAALTLAAIGVAGGVTAGWLLWKPGIVGNTPVPAAQLLPQETILFAEFPDLKASAARWQETSLWKIIHEPEVQSFLTRPRSKLPKEWATLKTNFKQADPRSAFVALTGIENNKPSMVIGLAFDGSRADVEKLVAEAKEKAQKASPAGKANLEKYKSFEIESFQDKDVTLAGAFAGDWYFIANEIDLLKATLDRFAGEGPALNNTDEYQKSIARVSAAPELRVFVKLSVLVERITSIAAVSGQPVDADKLAEIRKLKAFAATTRFDGERIRDTFFLLSPEATASPTLNGSSLGLTSPETLFYYAFAPVLSDKMEIPSQVADPSGILSSLQALTAQLTQQGIGIAEFKTAFGPEFSLISDWPMGTVSPTIALALEVRDATLARKFVEACCGSWNKEESEGVPFWSVESEGATVALTGKHLLVGPNLATVKAAAAKATRQSATKTLAASPAYEAALATVPKPGSTLGYVDAKVLFEQTYGSLRPAAMMAGAMIPMLANYVDVAKLPTTEPVSKHLLPSILSTSWSGDGYVTESTGTVTFTHGGLMIGTLGGAIIYNAMQGKLPLPGFGNPGAPARPRPKPINPAPKAAAPAVSTSSDEPASGAPASSD